MKFILICFQKECPTKEMYEEYYNFLDEQSKLTDDPDLVKYLN